MDESARRQNPGAVPDRRCRLAPMIFNLMDLTPEVNALVYGWTADSYELDSLTFKSGRRFHDGQPEVMLGDLLAGEPEQESRRHPRDSGLRLYCHRNLSRRHRAGSRRGHHAARRVAADRQPAREGYGVSCAASPRARRRIAEALCEARTGRRLRLLCPVCAPFPRRSGPATTNSSVLAHAAAWGTSSIALLIGILGIANTMAMSVFERTREIGILRALGWKRWRVCCSSQSEAAVLGFAGGILGIGDRMGLPALH